MARFVCPSAAIAATRCSLGVSDSRPLTTRRRGGLRPQAEERGLPPAELLVAAAELEQVLERLGRPALQQPEPRAAVEEPQHVAGRRKLLADAEPVERRRGAVEVAAVEQGVG